MLALIGIGLAAGFVTAISPCVLPVLPIVLAGGASGGKRRPYAIIAGLIATFTVSVLVAAWLLSLLGLPEDLLRNISIALLFVLAATLVFPRAGELLERPFLFLTRRRSRELGGGFLLGASLGFVFVPCAGPVLGVVSAQAAMHDIGWKLVALTLSYAVGAAVPLLAIALGARRTVGRVSFLRTHAITVRRALGIAMAATAVAILFNAPQHLQTALGDYTNVIQRHTEDTAFAQRYLKKVRPATHRTVRLLDYGTPAQFSGITKWLNTPHGRPLTMRSLRGKVVLVDFWTYSCINCLRTLPYLEAWDARYRKHGLVIVGVHSPEFAFEHVVSNVEHAVRRLHVKYPVAIDNQFLTWYVFGNQYWPEEYLIDRRGHLREVHAGEGGYSTTEQSIRTLLAEKSLPSATGLADHTPTEMQTPETYLGIARLERYVGSELQQGRWARYSFARAVPRDDISYAGRWKLGEQRIIAGADARVRLHFHARHVYIVLSGKGRVTVSVNGVTRPPIEVDGAKLYTVFDAPNTTDALLELGFARGLDAYSFTFG
jgi:cytochrome c biogenesis protein CcdA/thiol-disulfide isomerase/thioredoxin